MRSATIAAAAALLVGAAACGGDSEPEADDTREATLEALPGWAEALPDAVGSATVATADGATAFELNVSGLEQLAGYTAHVHDGTCDDTPPGGDHWLADPEQGDVESNWIHLMIETSVEGAGNGTADFDHVADDRARSVVVHIDIADSDQAARMPSDRVLCGDLE
ncbi:hypothetical protein [Glycomyces xiaoerkulensis]|uniref:hypothetical protein n=1 Tax=Glycomyces xiaoerkulensis TaxID=2038139 RepID=UPI000C25AB12|nr:hypothetical protein [Glycomyces xiaoerkulensis]